MGLNAFILAIKKTTLDGAKVTDVNVDKGGGDQINSKLFQNSGIDAVPRVEDYAQVSSDGGNGRASLVGTVDPKNAQKSNEGEIRIYSRDSSGEGISEIWLKDNGDILVENQNLNVSIKNNGEFLAQNGSGSFKLEAGGNFVVNGVTIDTSGNITGAANIAGSGNITGNGVDAPSITSGGKNLTTHTHPANNPPGNTGVNN